MERVDGKVGKRRRVRKGEVGVDEGEKSEWKRGRKEGRMRKERTGLRKEVHLKSEGRMEE